jgi:hypothetical protein
MIAGADSIDDLAELLHGGRGKLFNRIYAPSTLGSFLRTFRFGHVRHSTRWPPIPCHRVDGVRVSRCRPGTPVLVRMDSAFYGRHEASAGRYPEGDSARQAYSS